MKSKVEFCFSVLIFCAILNFGFSIETPEPPSTTITIPSLTSTIPTAEATTELTTTPRLPSITTTPRLPSITTTPNPENSETSKTCTTTAKPCVTTTVACVTTTISFTTETSVCTTAITATCTGTLVPEHMSEIIFKPKICKTSPTGTILFDSNHCRRYYVCYKGHAKLLKCPPNQWYDRARFQCRNRKEVKNCAVNRN